MKRFILLTCLVLAFALLTINMLDIKEARADEQQQLTTSVAFIIGQGEYYIDGKTPGIKMDAQAFIENGRIYVPLRYLANALGVDDKNFSWKDSKISLRQPGLPKLDLIIGSKQIMSNGQSETIDTAPIVKNGRTYLPARFVAEALGYQVGWDANSNVVLCWPKGVNKPDISSLIKTIPVDANKSIVWDAFIIGKGILDIDYIWATSDDDYVIAGRLLNYKDHSLIGTIGFWAAKFDNNGNKEWTNWYEYDKGSYPTGFEPSLGDTLDVSLQTPDGKRLVKINTNGVVVSDELLKNDRISVLQNRDGKLKVIKIGSDGKEIWSLIYGSGAWFDRMIDIKETSDGGYLALSVYDVYKNKGLRSNHLTKINSNGNIEWDLDFKADYPESLTKTPDGDYIITSSVYEDEGIQLIAVDRHGKLKWTKKGDSSIYGINFISNGYLLCYSKEKKSGDSYDYDMVVEELDINGNIKWTKGFYAEYGSLGDYAIKTNDGYYIAVGSKQDKPNVFSQPYIVKFKAP